MSPGPVATLNRQNNKASANKASAEKASQLQQQRVRRLMRLRRGATGRQAFVLYLDSRTWQEWNGGLEAIQLAAAVGDVLRAGFPLLLLHECDPQRGACEFARFFTTGDLLPSPPTLPVTCCPTSNPPHYLVPLA